MCLSPKGIQTLYFLLCVLCFIWFLCNGFCALSYLLFYDCFRSFYNLLNNFFGHFWFGATGHIDLPAGQLGRQAFDGHRRHLLYTRPHHGGGPAGFGATDLRMLQSTENRRGQMLREPADPFAGKHFRCHTETI